MGIREASTTQAVIVIEAPTFRPVLADWRAQLRAAFYELYRRHDLPTLPADEEIEGLVDLIDEGRAEPDSPISITRVTAEALGAAIFHELRLAARLGSPPESELVPTLVYMAVLPYIGTDAAAEELCIPPPPR